MSQANFAYGHGGPSAVALVAGIHAVGAADRVAFGGDALAAGFGVADYDLMSELDDPPRPLPGDVLYVDFPVDDASAIAALTALDARAATSGTPLVVGVNLSTLETAFACLDSARVELLVEPTKGERVLALARAVLKMPRMTVRELDEVDRMTLLRLTEQVAQIAAQIDRLSEGPPAFRLESPEDVFRGEGEEERKLIRAPRPPLPDPRLVRKIIRQRQLRAQFLGSELFADPAWDILLDLTAARAEHARVSVTSLCIASAVPATTALRWIAQMTEAGLLVRVEDESDRRRAFIELSDKSADAMARYFAEVGKDAKSLI